MEHFIYVVLALLLLSFILFMLIRQYRQGRMMQLRVRKLYASPVFEALSPMLKTAEKRIPEKITVDKTGILFHYVTPPGSSNAFLMKNYGFAYLTPEQQEAMLMVLQQCLPNLTDETRYRFTRKTHHLLNGNVEYSYSFVMANSYKITLARATYYDPRMQARLR